MASHSALAPPTRVPAGAPATGDGIALGTAPVVVDAFIDFLCPFCRMFEQQNGEALDALVDNGTITLVYHTLGFLDRLSTTRYSTRAAAASGCASDGGGFREYLYTLYDNQPPEGTAGLSDEELIQLGLETGLDEGFGRCMLAGGYIEWVDYVTARALGRGVNGTPSVYVNGVGVPASARAIRSQVG
ncbi:MAG TPA: thioredoxin domain-containing protein [Solirubrobacteraceae bacterium]|jgi:protein-disulfide isomerase|nr:thioredoxin domain-containing protein [Solirubrobacteraceae bacterium]